MSAILAKDAPHGRVQMALDCLSQPGLEVTSDDLQRNVIDEVISRRKVAAVIRGQYPPDLVAFDDLLVREVKIVQTICQMADVKCPNESKISERLFFPNFVIYLSRRKAVFCLHDNI